MFLLPSEHIAVHDKLCPRDDKDSVLKLLLSLSCRQIETGRQTGRKVDRRTEREREGGREGERKG